VFLQQLGRGLRLLPGKSLAHVARFIGQALRPLPPRPRYPPARRQSATSLAPADRKPASPSSPRLQPPSSIASHGAGAFKFARSLTQPPAPAGWPNAVASGGPCSLAALLEVLGMELGSFYRWAGVRGVLPRSWGGAGAASGRANGGEDRLGAEDIAAAAFILDDPKAPCAG